MKIGKVFDKNNTAIICSFYCALSSELGQKRSAPPWGGAGRERSLSVWIDGIGAPHEQIAVGDAVLDRDAHADAVRIRCEHGPKVAGRVFPVGHRPLGDIRCGGPGEHRQIGAEAVGVSAGRHRLTLLPVVVPSVAPVRAYLRRRHEMIIHRQLRHTVLPPHRVDQLDDFLPYRIQFRDRRWRFGDGLATGRCGVAHRQCQAGCFPVAACGGEDRCTL